MAMSELKQKLLIYELAKIGFRDAQYHPTSDRVQVQPDNERMPVINDAGEIMYGTEYNSLAVNTLRPIVGGVNEAAAAWDKSHTLPFKDLSQFRVLAEYNNIMLAARDDTVYGRGLHFVTWQYNYNRTGLDHGHYTEDYNSAKEDFAGRSGLIPAVKLFTQEQAVEIRNAVLYRIENDSDLPIGAEEHLKMINARLMDGYGFSVDTPTKVEMPDYADPSDPVNLSSKSETQIQTAQTIYGEVKPSDWVIAAGNSDYGYLIGTVTAIDKLGTSEHETENDTDDIHIDFTAFDYPPERISEIEENFSDLYGEPKTFDELPLDDVIMAPDELISISNLSFDEITRMGNLRQNCEAFCNCFPGAVIPQNKKHATLIERIKTNLADYHSSLMDLGKQELIDMAEKIAAMSSAYSYLSYRGFENDELDFFLRFQNPLEIMAEGWRDYHADIDDEMGFAFDTVIHHKQNWLDSYPLMNDTAAPARTDFPIGSMETHPQHLTEIHNSPEPPARMPKQSLEERLHAAGEKAKAQNALNNDTKSHKRDERS